MLTIQNLHKAYQTHTVLDQVSLELPQGQVLAVLGRSGCGKTTLLKALAGLLTLDAGSINWAGESMDAVPSREREMVYLFQEPLLFPHLSVFENLAYGLRVRKEAEAQVQQKVVQMLQELELQEHAQKKPSHLSGGQRQRVAFGRAIIFLPRVLLLDEPFASLDAQSRASMQRLFLRLARKYNITALFVTHEVKEALLVGDRFAYMAAGKLQVYTSKDAFIADPQTGVRDELAFWSALEQQTTYQP
ncbi:ABC transporter ATP-binding protein [Pontibacter chinhatensis]|uniref:Putrescine transport system ATP-binding protein n=1 Tax=Pontibacter chinhatensis TaxID=1436961 RepID=A0A1I2NLZ8_9BACT|nr:ABC transporter ATP-binding protein [Pontibacter chinhatensis]SFG04658.1 putrescine transport system ATP-binding protein [Pontibacter chinhatensis]